MEADPGVTKLLEFTKGQEIARFKASFNDGIP